jgi:hypothetical protein
MRQDQPVTRVKAGAARPREVIDSSELSYLFYPVRLGRNHQSDVPFGAVCRFEQRGVERPDASGGWVIAVGQVETSDGHR